MLGTPEWSKQGYMDLFHLYESAFKDAPYPQRIEIEKDRQLDMRGIWKVFEFLSQGPPVNRTTLTHLKTAVEDLTQHAVRCQAYMEVPAIKYLENLTNKMFNAFETKKGFPHWMVVLEEAAQLIMVYVYDRQEGLTHTESFVRSGFDETHRFWK